MTASSRLLQLDIVNRIGVAAASKAAIVICQQIFLNFGAGDFPFRNFF